MEYLQEVLSNLSEDVVEVMLKLKPAVVAECITRLCQKEKLKIQASSDTILDVDTTTSHGIGVLGEDLVESILRKEYSDELISTAKTPHSCDFKLRRISIEVKNYGRTVQTPEIEKFKSDVIKQRMLGGVIISLRSHFVGGKYFSISHSIDTDGERRVYTYVVVNDIAVGSQLILDAVLVCMNYIALVNSGYNTGGDSDELDELYHCFERVNNFVECYNKLIADIEKLRAHTIGVLDGFLVESRYLCMSMLDYINTVKRRRGSSPSEAGTSIRLSWEDVYQGCRVTQDAPLVKSFAAAIKGESRGADSAMGSTAAVSISKGKASGSWTLSDGPYGSKVYTLCGTPFSFMFFSKKSRIVLDRNSLTEKLLLSTSVASTSTNPRVVIDSMTSKKIVLVLTIDCLTLCRSFLSSVGVEFV